MIQTYIDDLTVASYTDNDGVQHNFEIVNYERSASRKTTTHQIANNIYPIVQDKGLGNQQYQINALFNIGLHGEDFAKKADALYNSFKKTGRGTLNHARYGLCQIAIISFSQKETEKELGTSIIQFNAIIVAQSEVFSKEFTNNTTRDILLENARDTVPQDIRAQDIRASIISAAETVSTISNEATEYANKTLSAIGNAIADPTIAVATIFGVSDAIMSIRNIENNTQQIIARATSYANIIINSNKINTSNQSNNSYKRIFPASLTPIYAIAYINSIANISMSIQPYTRQNTLDIMTVFTDTIASMQSIAQITAEITQTIRITMTYIHNIMMQKFFNAQIQETIKLIKNTYFLDSYFMLYNDEKSVETFIDDNTIASFALFTMPAGREIVKYE